MTGDDLLDFVNKKLFPYLTGFKAKATGPNTIEYKVGEIFSEIKNRIKKNQSGYNLREVIDHVDELRFQSQTEKHELSHLYEAKIKTMGTSRHRRRHGAEAWARPSATRRLAQPAFCASRSTTSKRRTPSVRRRRTARCRNGPSTGRKRSRSRM